MYNDDLNNRTFYSSANQTKEKSHGERSHKKKR